MRLGIVGRGRWGRVYAETLDRLGIGHEWGTCGDGVIVATPRQTHYGIARELIPKTPILLEKPVTLDAGQAWELVRLGGIVYTGHTRLFSPSWRKFKASLPSIQTVDAVMGRLTDDPWWEIGPHLVAMCLDCGFDPRKARLRVAGSFEPLSFTVNGEFTFSDVAESPSPLEVLITEFVQAIRLGKPDNRGMVLGARVVEFLNEPRGLHIAQDGNFDGLAASFGHDEPGG